MGFPLAKRAVSYLMLGTLFMAGIPLQAFANSSSEITSRRSDVDDDKDTIDNKSTGFKKQIEDQKKLIVITRSSDAKAKYSDTACGPNFCGSAAAACAEDLKKRNISDADLNASGNTCEYLYDGADETDGKKDLSNFKGSCREKIRACGTVKLQLDVAFQQSRLADLEVSLTEAKAKLKEDQKALDTAYENCPSCQQADAFGYNREPSKGEKLIGTINALTPWVLGGLGVYAYGKGINAYSNNYNAYLQQCMTIGVPCQGPSGFGGGFGGGFNGGGFGGGFNGGGFNGGGFNGGGFNGGFASANGFGGGFNGGGFNGGGFNGGGFNGGGFNGGGFNGGFASANGFGGGFNGGGFNGGGFNGGGFNGGGFNSGGFNGGGFNGGFASANGFGGGFNGGGFNGGFASANGFGGGFNDGGFNGGGFNGGGFNGGGFNGGGFNGGGFNGGGFASANGFNGGGFASANGFNGGGFASANGFNGGGFNGSGTSGAGNYNALLQLQLQSQILNAQRAQESQSDLMLSQQQVYEAEYRANQAAQNAYGYSGGYSGGLNSGFNGSIGVNGSLGFGIH